MTVRHRCSNLFWGTIARIGHLLQRREVRALEKQVYQQGRMIHSLVAANIELHAQLRGAGMDIEATQPGISEELAA